MAETPAGVMCITKELKMNKLFDVVIQARITKTILVEAKDEDEAHELAHESFSVMNDQHKERYEQETIKITQV